MYCIIPNEYLILYIEELYEISSEQSAKYCPISHSMNIEQKINKKKKKINIKIRKNFIWYSIFKVITVFIPVTFCFFAGSIRYERKISYFKDDFVSGEIVYFLLSVIIIQLYL
jgi:hypothetical protein